MIDIMNIEPTKIQRNLGSLYIFIYGLEKVGKTTWASQIPDNLFLATEKGYNLISGLNVVDITKWSDFKTAVLQLERQEAREKYKTVTIDTLEILYNQCEAYILNKYGVNNVSEIPYGAGWGIIEKEFDTELRKIARRGGLIAIGHANIALIKDPGSTAENPIYFEKVSPKLNKRAQSTINKIVDIVGYISLEYNSDGSSDRTVITRRDPLVVAGSRFKYLPAKIPFNHEEFQKAVNIAIDRQVELDGATAEDIDFIEVKEEISFEQVHEEARAAYEALVEQDEANVEKIYHLIESIFGLPRKLSTVGENQREMLELTLFEMKQMLKRTNT